MATVRDLLSLEKLSGTDQGMAAGGRRIVMNGSNVVE